MGQGKYSRVDGKKSSCSTAKVMVVVGICIIGVWMSMSSSVASGQNPDLPAQNSKTESKAKVSTNPSPQFEDNSGDHLPVNQETGQGGGDPNTMETTSNDEEPLKVEINDEEPSSRNEECTKKDVENGDEKTNDEKPSSRNEESNTGDDYTSSESDQPKSKSEDEDSSSKVTDVNSDTNETEKKQKSNIKTETEAFPAADQSEILHETRTENGAAESASEKESRQPDVLKDQDVYEWKTCNVTTGPDFIPCLDNIEALRKIHTTLHYEHRERHCPAVSPTCLVPLPQGYKSPIRWPRSRDQIWYSSVPNTKLAVVKGHQNWVKVTGEYLSFPGGGTQFKNGAHHYIDHITKSFPGIEWGKRSRVILDVGCGVASFGGYLFERDVITMSFAPKDKHEAKVNLPLRGVFLPFLLSWVPRDCPSQVKSLMSSIVHFAESHGTLKLCLN